MDELSVCTLQFAGSDAQNNIAGPPSSASATDADTVINTKTDSTQVEGGKSDEELLKGLLTDDYCHVCEAVLLFESQRLSHYEGKKHSQKLKVYLQAKRAEKMNKESTGPQRMLTADKDRFCELCNMVFSSPVVAKSHYEGKVHSKNLRKQSLQTADRHAEGNSLQIQNHDLANDDDHKSASEDGGEPPLDPTTTSTMASVDVDLKDPNKYCPLCAASFNNPQMALQHYNGRKHQRNAARQVLLRELGDDSHQDTRLKCQICSVQFNSVEMYQAHMQGNKHHTREKKVIDLCKSQQKSYNTFADELADYIQVQKARGLTPKTAQGPAAADAPGENEQEEVEGFSMTHFTMPSKPIASHSPASNLPHHQPTGSYYPVESCRPHYQGAPWVSGGWDYNCPPLSLPGSGASPFNMGPLKRPRRRKQSSSSSSSTSSSSSSSSSSYSSSYSSTSGSEDSEHRLRERKRMGRSRRGRGRRARDEDSDKQARRRRQHRRAREGEEEEGRGDGHGETEKDRRRKRPKNHNKRRKREKSPQEDFGDEREAVCLQPTGDMAASRKETEVHIQTEISVEQQEERADEAAKTKLRKEKKKTREKVDTRTEEEKLWDDSILGC